ncbi:hypothetical protein CVT26_003993 [Gymnopilus dilepis]|uniref:DUF6535 domain-containing protein n=1 Tax=Gymnopilus dilepis TaxID=231916 RepID=A0A409YV74_9AGAR|nr:hypothetical protein CVT26_003993 [Gymnopilus dilepis]
MPGSTTCSFCIAEIVSFKRWNCDDPYRYSAPDDPDPWQKLLDPLLAADTAQCESWKDEVQNLLVFAGLFSAVVTAFVVESYASLQPDQSQVVVNLLAHIAIRLDANSSAQNASLATISAIDPASLAAPVPASSIRINVLCFISLVLSLTTALIGIVSLQWLREHRRYPNTLSSRDKFAIYNMRKEGLTAWYVPQIIASLPVLLQIALVLFFVGMIDFLFVATWKVAIPVVMTLGIPFTFLFATTTLPTLQNYVFFLPLGSRPRRVPQQTPYKSPQSQLFRHLVGSSRRFVELGGCSIHRAYCALLTLRTHLRQWTRLPQQPISATRRSEYDLQQTSTVIFWALRDQGPALYDQMWVKMRDSYARSIFARQEDLNLEPSYSPIHALPKPIPFYDLVRGVAQRLYLIPDRRNGDSADVRMCYLCVRDLISPFKEWYEEEGWYTLEYQYLQALLNGMGDISQRPKTLFSILNGPPIGFFQDETMFIFFLRLSSGLPPSSGLFLQQFCELRVRLANYLFSVEASGRMRQSMLATPSDLEQWTSSLGVYSVGSEIMNLHHGMIPELEDGQSQLLYKHGR